MDYKNGGVTDFGRNKERTKNERTKIRPCLKSVMMDGDDGVNACFKAAGACSCACLCILLPFFIGFWVAGVGWGGDGSTSSIDGYSKLIAGCCAPDAIPKWLDPCYVLHDGEYADNGSASCVADVAESMLAALRS